MSLSRTPVNQPLKRRLEPDFNEPNSNNEPLSASKKMNSSANRSDLENSANQKFGNYKKKKRSPFRIQDYLNF